MFQKKLFGLLLLLTPSLFFAQLSEIPAPNYIKTIQFKGATAQSELPVIRLGERLQLSFDALNGEEEDFYYTITHHNFDWSESDLSKSEYLDGFDDVRIETYENSLNTLQIFRITPYQSLTAKHAELQKAATTLFLFLTVTTTQFFHVNLWLLRKLPG